MLNRQNKARLKIRSAVISLIFFGIAIVSLMSERIPAFSAKSAYAQSIHSTDSLSNISAERIVGQQMAQNRQDSATTPEINMPERAVNRVGTAFSGRRSVSIKSTDAGIVPRYPQTSACINCGTVDFVNAIGQGNNLDLIAGGIIGGVITAPETKITIQDLITGGIIGGVIRNKVIRHGQHYPADSTRGGNYNPGYQTGNPSAHNNNRYDVGVTLDDGTKAIITQQNAPQFHHGDRVQLIDGVVVPDQ
ncbi:MAG: hypothetical protein Q8K59_04005 [Nitrosomonas sp.]|nr:hypothetical protein [Nitrosomonas sp.]MDP1950252.1 hypothetical protein [Nitrosomonas sp.]